jgi:hypothetical protein
MLGLLGLWVGKNDAGRRYRSYTYDAGVMIIANWLSPVNLNNDHRLDLWRSVERNATNRRNPQKKATYGLLKNLPFLIPRGPAPRITNYQDPPLPEKEEVFEPTPPCCDASLVFQRGTRCQAVNISPMGRG